MTLCKYVVYYEYKTTTGGVHVNTVNVEILVDNSDSEEYTIYQVRQLVRHYCSEKHGVYQILNITQVIDDVYGAVYES